MKRIYIVLLAWLYIMPATAGELIPLNSTKGQALLTSAESKADFFTLINHFESQKNGIFCGVTSATIVLNSFYIPFGDGMTAPESLGLTYEESAYLPRGLNPTLKRYTQMNIFNPPYRSPKGMPAVKTLAEVLGKGNPKDVGFQLRQLSTLLTAHRVQTRVHPVTESTSAEVLITDIAENLARNGDAILVNYRRDVLGQKGGGHISPLGAYNAASRMFLILDVNPTRAPFVWVNADDLIRAMQTFDTIENRGYMHVSR